MTTGVDVTATVELLRYALEHRALVRVERVMARSDLLDGFVVGVDPAWTLLADLTNLQLDGYVAVRTADVERLTFRVGPTPLDVRALQLDGTWPAQPPPLVALGSLRDVLDMAAAYTPIVHLETELETPDEAYVGRVVDVSDAHVELLEISEHAEWDDAPVAFAVADITRVEFGSRYLNALQSLGGDPPPG